MHGQNSPETTSDVPNKDITAIPMHATLDNRPWPSITSPHGWPRQYEFPGEVKRSAWVQPKQKRW